VPWRCHENGNFDQPCWFLDVLLHPAVPFSKEISTGSGLHEFCSVAMSSPKSKHAIPRSGAMDLIGEFARRLYWELFPVFNWVIRHWAITLAVIAILIYWAGRQRRPRKHL
jgi:hypothetical protein